MSGRNPGSSRSRTAPTRPKVVGRRP
jgi:hypothetical protein